jgi:hypothetical protein
MRRKGAGNFFRVLAVRANSKFARDLFCLFGIERQRPSENPANGIYDLCKM